MGEVGTGLYEVSAGKSKRRRSLNRIKLRGCMS
jgi:hypothetical protein